MQISNILLIYIFLFIALLCFFFTKELYTTNIGKALLCGVSLFWFIRTIEQFIFLRINNKWVHILTALFIAGTILVLLPVFFKKDLTAFRCLQRYQQQPMEGITG
jgi:hypothetical protein